MAFQKKGIQDKGWVADYLSDLKNIPASSMGSTCWIIETAEKYMINSEGEWVLQTLSTNGKGNNPGGSNPDLSNYVTINQMNAAIAQMQATDKDIVAYSDAQDKIITDKVNELNEESTVWGVLPE